MSFARALAVFIVDGDALDRNGLYGFDTVKIFDPIQIGEQCAAVFAQVVVRLSSAFFPHVGVAALAANTASDSGELAGA